MTTRPAGYRAMGAVLRVHRMMTSVVDAELRAGFSLRLMEYVALTALQSSDGGTNSLGGLARRMHVNATTVTVATERLEQLGLVSRKGDPQDRRRTRVGITAQGRAVADAATAVLTSVDFGLPGLTADQKRTLISLLERVQDR